MDTTTTTAEAMAGPVVVPAINAAAQSLQRLGEALGREASRIAMTTTGLQHTAQEIVTQITEPARKAAEGIAAHRHRLAAAGRSHRLASLDADARRIAHGHGVIAVRIAHLIADLHAQGRDYEADLVAAALRGDEVALRDIGSLVGEGSPLGLLVLAIATDLDALTDAVTVFTTEVADLIAEVSAADLHDLTDPLPPPRMTLAGSVDTTAPPAALQRGSGMVHPVFSHREAA